MENVLELFNNDKDYYFIHQQSFLNQAIFLHCLMMSVLIVTGIILWTTNVFKDFNI